MSEESLSSATGRLFDAVRDLAGERDAALARTTALEAECHDLAQRLELEEQLSRQTQFALEKAQHDVRVLQSENDCLREGIRMMEGVDYEQSD